MPPKKKSTTTKRIPQQATGAQKTKLGWHKNKALAHHRTAEDWGTPDSDVVWKKKKADYRVAQKRKKR